MTVVKIIISTTPFLSIIILNPLDFTRHHFGEVPDGEISFRNRIVGDKGGDEGDDVVLLEVRLELCNYRFL